MTDFGHEPAGIGVAYEDTLPLSWVSLQSEPDDSQYVRIETINTEMLRMLAAMDEGHNDGGEDQLHAPELQRIESKLNLVLELVSHLFSQHVALPERVVTRLCGEHIEWHGAEAPDEGSLVKVEVYLSDKYPRPLILPSRVANVQPSQGGYAIRAAFLAMSDSVQDHLDKFIFKQHRRLVAHKRRAHSDHGG